MKSLVYLWAAALCASIGADLAMLGSVYTGNPISVFNLSLNLILTLGFVVGLCHCIYLSRKYRK